MKKGILISLLQRTDIANADSIQKEIFIYLDEQISNLKQKNI